MKFILILLLLSGCAPMPGNVLFKGLEHDTPLNNVKVVEHIGWVVTTKTCDSLLYTSGNYKPLVLNCILNGCVVFGCAQALWDENGDIYQCNVYLAWDSDHLRKHELRHCMGYADDLY